MEIGQIGGRQRYELRVSRRDGRRIHREPRPVIETFDIDNDREVEEIVGRHFIPMAAHAEERSVDAWESVSSLRGWLPDYQCEIWRVSGSPSTPEMVSMSTRGWKD